MDNFARPCHTDTLMTPHNHTSKSHLKMHRNAADFPRSDPCRFFRAMIFVLTCRLSMVVNLNRMCAVQVNLPAGSQEDCVNVNRKHVVNLGRIDVNLNRKNSTGNYLTTDTVPESVHRNGRSVGCAGVK